MAITFDQKVEQTGTATPLNSLLTISASSKLAIVGISVRDDSTHLCDSVTIGGANATLAVRQINTGNILTSDIWYLINPPTGNMTIQATFGANDNFKLIATSWEFGNAPVLDNTGGAVGNSASVLSVLTTLNNTAVVQDMVIHESTDACTLANSDNTLLFATDEGVWDTAASYRIVSSAGNATMSWSNGRSDTWAQASASFYESAGGGGGPVYIPPRLKTLLGVGI